MKKSIYYDNSFYFILFLKKVIALFAHKKGRKRETGKLKVKPQKYGKIFV